MNNILLVDLEATCWNDRPQSCETMEIIEFGCANVDLDGNVLSKCSQLVLPVSNPKLSDFCQSLTGIQQADVDTAPSYIDAVTAIDEMLSGKNYDVWGSWGQYDFNQIKAEKLRHGIAPQFFSVPHINVKRAFQKTVGRRRKTGLRNALKSLGMEFEGNQHRALDDTLNIARIMPYIDAKHLEIDDVH